LLVPGLAKPRANREGGAFFPMMRHRSLCQAVNWVQACVYAATIIMMIGARKRGAKPIDARRTR